MTVRKILHYPDPKLRIQAQKVEVIDKAIHDLIHDMFETMYENRGCGLAATQIAGPKRVVVIDLGRDKPDPYVLINPEIIEQSGEQVEEEGCLSVPGIYEKVKRSSYVKVEAQDRQGKEFIIEADHSYLAQAIQHELDHLNGRLFIDYLSSLKRERAKKKLQKMRQETY